jgi:hypothetical protein
VPGSHGTLKTWLRRRLGANAYWRAKRILDRFVLRYRNKSWAQSGEDLFLAAYFGDRRDGAFVDVGAFHPRRFSNTWRLYRRGWRGLNIDATPGSMRLFDALRPGDTNVEAVVSDSPEPVRFSSWGLHAENTMDPAQTRAMRKARGAPDAVIEATPRTLTDLLDASPLRDRRLDLLSVDAEGNDLAVLHSLDWSRYHPRIVIAEVFAADVDVLLASGLYAFVTRQGYRLVAWHRPSAIFERREDADRSV